MPYNQNDYNKLMGLLDKIFTKTVKQVIEVSPPPKFTEIGPEGVDFYGRLYFTLGLKPRGTIKMYFQIDNGIVCLYIEDTKELFMEYIDFHTIINLTLTSYLNSPLRPTIDNLAYLLLI